MDNRKQLRRLTWTAVFIALVAVAAMLIQTPTVATSGFINLGDTMNFVAALVGGRQAGLIAGGVGSALADVLTGYAHWAPWALVIKGIEGSIAGVIACGAYRRHGPLLSRSSVGRVTEILWEEYEVPCRRSLASYDVGLLVRRRGVRDVAPAHRSV